LPSGKNIYEMTNSQSLNQLARSISDKCLFEHSGTAGVGENIYYNTARLSQVDAIKAAIKLWVAELPSAGLNTDMILRIDGFENIGHYTAIIWASTIFVGCGVTYCPGKYTIVFCNYRPQGNIIDSLIYQPGPGCTADSQCTTYPNSTCNVSTRMCKTTAAEAVSPVAIDANGKPLPNIGEQKFAIPPAAKGN